LIDFTDTPSAHSDLTGKERPSHAAKETLKMSQRQGGVIKIDGRA
jgi:hypothetical protein